MSTLAFLQNINGPEILLIFLIVLLLFGAKRLPELFRSFGKSIREFKKATSEIEEDIRTAMDEEPTKNQKKNADTAPREVESGQADSLPDESTQAKSFPGAGKAQSAAGGESVKESGETEKTEKTYSS